MGVVGAQLPTAVTTEHALHQRAEDGRVDLAPVMLGSLGDQGQLVLVEVDLGRLGEQLAVDVSSASEDSLTVVVALLVEDAEEHADLRGRRPRGVLSQGVDDVLQRIAVEHAQVLGEQRPDALQGEALDLVDRRGAAFLQRLVEQRDRRRRLFGQLAVVVDERWREGRCRQEHQGLVAVGELLDLEADPRRRWEAAGLPDLEALERAQHNIGGGRKVVDLVRRLAPVTHDLLARL